jgi:uncharacterized protein (TIGR03086 family)
MSERELTEPAVFVLADRALEAVVAQISDEQWEMPMPVTFAIRQTTDVPNLRQVINYHAYDDAWVPDMLAGRTMEEAGADTFDGDLLGKDAVASFAAIVEKSCAAAAEVRDLDQIAHLSFGDYSIREYLWQINFFRGVRAYEIAGIIGCDPTLPPELVQGLWDEVSPNAEEWRTIGVFGPAIEVPGDAPLMDRLLGLTGRDPSAG